ncbi:MAG: methyl-accepting chemotaxis protein [Candidatus Omnitrophica bacterium]|nr:methyl-accepting chemotaxis protein [Candidatus Omnitrophota bacterium]
MIVTVFVAQIIAGGITNPVRQMVGLLSALAVGGGDLTQSFMIKTKDELAELAKSFNTFIGTLHGLVCQVRDSAEQVSDSSKGLSATTHEVRDTARDIADTIRNVASGVVNQAQKVDSAAATMGNMTLSVRDVATNAQAATRASERASETAEAGGILATETFGKMAEVNKCIHTAADVVKQLAARSQQITEILDVLTQIADQTNLLALNAAIEAARAGESGRGFAVVAEEVRKLAENSAVSSKSIGRLVVEIQQQTVRAVSAMESSISQLSEGTRQVSSVGEALQEIVAAAGEALDIVSRIATATDEQLRATEDISGAIREIAAIARDSATVSEQAASSTEEQNVAMNEMAAGAQQLDGTAANLRDIVCRFKL